MRVPGVIREFSLDSPNGPCVMLMKNSEWAKTILPDGISKIRECVLLLRSGWAAPRMGRLRTFRICRKADFRFPLGESRSADYLGVGKNQSMAHRANSFCLYW